MLKRYSILSVLLFIFRISIAQQILPVKEDFNNASAITWTTNANEAGMFSLWKTQNVGGLSNSGVLRYNDYKYIASENSVESPEFNFTDAENPYIEFDLAIANYYHFTPVLTLSIDSGDGWKEQQGWTSGFTILLPEELHVDSIKSQRLTYSDSLWIPDHDSFYVAVKVPLPFLAGKERVKFKFDVKCYYGGEVFMDNIKIADQIMAGTLSPVTPMQIQLFPNPSKESITIRIPEKASYSIQVFDGMGNKIRSFITDAGEIQLDLSQFQAGAYFIEGIGGSKQFSQKFIVE